MGEYLSEWLYQAVNGRVNWRPVKIALGVFLTIPLATWRCSLPVPR